ncbi:hypothetical protein SynROS8604_02506 [Synechococcus sp. ROS8604]|nr:hypothetical protein SynROS8604_02506 [Synechococcus sp. ROS8604]
MPSDIGGPCCFYQNDHPKVLARCRLNVRLHQEALKETPWLNEWNERLA